MPDFGIGETLAGLGLGDALGLGGLFGGGAALDTGLATVGAGLGEAGAAGGGLADIVGTGAGLFGGTTGLEGTALAGGFGGGLDALLGGGALGGALGTAEAFMGAPAASGFSPAAITPGAAPFSGGQVTPGAGAPGGGPGILSGISPPPQPTAAGGVSGTSVFDTGAPGLTGVSGTGAPAATVPAGANAASVAAPTGVSGLIDPTAVGAATGAGQAAGGTAGAGSTSIMDLLKGAGGSAIKSLTGNPLGTALGAAGLGYNILQGQKQSANEKALQGTAQSALANSNQMVQQGEALQKYLTDGTLPAAYQQQVDQAIQSAKARAISNAAAQGQPTDPTQNTALAQTLASIDNQRGAMQSQVASQLFASGQGLIGSGLQATGLSGNLYQTLVQNDTTQAANTGKAIATLAAALSGKSQNQLGGITISTG